MVDDSFRLFCWYYLGLNPQGQYKFVNANHIARQFNWTVDDLMRQLHKQGIHPDVVVNTDFPLAKWQVEIQLAAESESPDELSLRAQRVYQEFLQAVGHKRDWLKEIEQEREEDLRRRQSN
ncbi:MAG TPA: hypothetical protein VL359_15385 [bacterium]|nr:hypothetical protein [bacterium]